MLSIGVNDIHVATLEWRHYHPILQVGKKRLSVGLPHPGLGGELLNMAGSETWAADPCQAAL